MPRALRLLIPLLIGCFFWYFPPLSISPQAAHLLAIFLATIIGIILDALPMGVLSLTALFITLITHTLTFHEAFGGFSNHVVWLIVFAFFIARAFIKTGLGARISYLFMYFFGKKTIGLGYSLVLTDFILSSSIPSSTARSGGLLLPIIESLAESFESKGHTPSARRIGSYLALVGFHTGCISSALFITAMAVNPLIVAIASDMQIPLNWTSWALAAALPGLLSLALLPFLIYLLHPPQIHATPDASLFAQNKLQAMGPLKWKEWAMLGTFILLIALWMIGPYIQMEATVTALLGVVLLILSNILTWKEIRSEESAWETFIWFSVLLTLASYLQQLGVTKELANQLTSFVDPLHWTSALALIALIYFYSHYFFASILAHVTALYPAFLTLAIQVGAPPYLAALLLGFLSSLFGCLTQYSCGPAAILFGAGYVSAKTWWRVGFIMSLIHLLVWGIVGSFWWKLLGFW